MYVAEASGAYSGTEAAWTDTPGPNATTSAITSDAIAALPGSVQRYVAVRPKLKPYLCLAAIAGCQSSAPRLVGCSFKGHNATILVHRSHP